MSPLIHYPNGTGMTALTRCPTLAELQSLHPLMSMPGLDRASVDQLLYATVAIIRAVDIVEGNDVLISPDATRILNKLQSGHFYMLDQAMPALQEMNDAVAQKRLAIPAPIRETLWNRKEVPVAGTDKFSAHKQFDNYSQRAVSLAHTLHMYSASEKDGYHYRWYDMTDGFFRAWHGHFKGKLSSELNTRFEQTFHRIDDTPRGETVSIPPATLLPMLGVMAYVATDSANPFVAPHTKPLPPWLNQALYGNAYDIIGFNLYFASVVGDSGIEGFEGNLPFDLPVLGTLVHYTEEKILSRRGIGPAKIAHIKNRLAAKGLSLGMDVPYANKDELNEISRKYLESQTRAVIEMQEYKRFTDTDQLPISVLKFPPRLQKSLKDAGITSVGDLVQHGREELRGLDGIGSKFIREIEAKLLLLGLMVGPLPY